VRLAAPAALPVWLDGLGWAEKARALAGRVVTILLVLLAARLAIVLLVRLVDRVASRAPRHPRVLDRRRVQTLAAVAKSVIRYALDFVALVTSLSLLGVDTSSLLLGAGIAGLAVGFGAQNLVRDVLTGFFILLEDQYAVGDYVSLGGVEGVVEEIGLRTTLIRAPGGELHILPNGTIQRVTNFSRGPLRVLFEVEVPYEEDTARARQVLQEAFDRYAADSGCVVEGPRVLGVARLSPTGVALLVWARVKAMEHWAVERDLKLVAKEALDRAGIPIPRRYRSLRPRRLRRADAMEGPEGPPAKNPAPSPSKGSEGE